jgi:transcriptional regulator of NAD metabolism
MTNEEIIEQIQTNQWWPFDRVDPKILQEVIKREKQEQLDNVEEALL